MPTGEELMQDVRRVYESIRSLHSVASWELSFEDNDDQEKSLVQWEIWFKSPRLRIDAKPLTVPTDEAVPWPSTIIADGVSEYRLSHGRWTKTRPGDPVGLLAIHGLFDRPTYTSDPREGELCGRRVWVVQGRVWDCVVATWWIDKDCLTVRKYKLEREQELPSGTDLAPAAELVAAVAVEFQTFEPGVEVPDERFSVPSDIPLEKWPMFAVFEDLLHMMRRAQHEGGGMGT